MYNAIIWFIKLYYYKPNRVLELLKFCETSEKLSALLYNRTIAIRPLKLCELVDSPVPIKYSFVLGSVVIPSF